MYRYRGTFEFESDVDGLRDEYNKSNQKLHTHKNGGREGWRQAGREGGREGGKDGGTVKAKSPWRVLDKISRHLKSRILFM